MASSKSKDLQHVEKSVRNLFEQLKSHTFEHPALVKKIWVEERNKPGPRATVQHGRDPQQFGGQVQLIPGDILNGSPGTHELIERVIANVGFDGLHTLLNEEGFVLSKASFACVIAASIIVSRRRALVGLTVTSTHAVKPDHSAGQSVERIQKRRSDDAFGDEKPVSQVNKKQAKETVESTFAVNSMQDEIKASSLDHAALEPGHVIQNEMKLSTSSDVGHEVEGEATTGSASMEAEQQNRDEIKPSNPSCLAMKNGLKMTNKPISHKTEQDKQNELKPGTSLDAAIPEERATANSSSSTKVKQDISNETGPGTPLDAALE